MSHEKINKKRKKVYEMICSHGIDEEERMLYDSNTEETRAAFIKYMKHLMMKELQMVKDLPCEGDVKRHLENLYNETLGHIETMKDKFVEKQEAFINPFIFLKIEERFIIKT